MPSTEDEVVRVSNSSNNMKKSHRIAKRLRRWFRRASCTGKKQDEHGEYDPRTELSRFFGKSPTYAISSETVSAVCKEPPEPQEPARKIARKPVPMRKGVQDSSGSNTDGSLQSILLGPNEQPHDRSSKVHFAALPRRLYSEPWSWSTTEQLHEMVKRWLDPKDAAEPSNEFEHACPNANHHIRGIMKGDGINDWVTRAAALTELDRVRIPLLEASLRGLDDEDQRDLQALQAVYSVILKMGVYGVARW